MLKCIIEIENTTSKMQEKGILIMEALQNQKTVLLNEGYVSKFLKTVPLLQNVGTVL